MSIASTVEAMAAAGCSVEQIVAVVRRHEQDMEAKTAERRAKDAERKRRSRVRSVTRTDEESNGHNVTPQDGADKGSPSLFPSSSPPITPLITTQNSSSPKITRDHSLESEFDEQFWPAWPHKVGKPAAILSFRRARKAHTLAVILDGVRAYIAGKPEDRPWLNPATFLNQERFMDQPAARSAVPAGASKSPIVDRQAGKTWCPDSSELYRAWEAYRPKYVKMMTEERGDDRGAWLPPLPHDCSLGINREGESA